MRQEGPGVEPLTTILDGTEVYCSEMDVKSIKYEVGENKPLNF